MSGHGAIRLARGRQFKNASQAVRFAEALFAPLAPESPAGPTDWAPACGSPEPGRACFRAYAEAPCADMLRRSGAPLTRDVGRCNASQFHHKFCGCEVTDVNVSPYENAETA